MTCTPHIQPLQEDEDCTSDAVVAEKDGKAFREGRQAGWGGWLAGMAG